MIESYEGFQLERDYDINKNHVYYYKDDNGNQIEIEDIGSNYLWSAYKKGKTLPAWMGRGESIEDCLTKATKLY